MLNLPKDQKYLLACSFGPDSMALFHMLKKSGYNFSVAHVNYHLRPEANEETLNLKKYAKENNIEIFIHEVFDLNGQSGLEEKCRNIRYNFFKKIVEENHFSSLLVAHQQDDVLETYIMQKRRKSIVRYFGIKDDTILFGIRVIRPLLNFSKNDLLMYVKNNHVPFSIDSSNLSSIFTRNKIRHEVVEKLSMEERKKMLDDLSLDNKKRLQQIQYVESIKTLDVDTLNKMDNISFAIYLNENSFKLGNNKPISIRKSNEIYKALVSKKPNIQIPFFGKYFVLKEYQKISFKHLKDLQINYSFVIEQPMELDTDYFYLNFTLDTKNRNVFPHSYPLTIRNIQKDDVYKIKGYEVQARRLLIDWKVPLSSRKKWPVIVDNMGVVIYIPRYQDGFKPEKGCNFYVK